MSLVSASRAIHVQTSPASREAPLAVAILFFLARTKLQISSTCTRFARQVPQYSVLIGGAGAASVHQQPKNRVFANSGQARDCANGTPVRTADALTEIVGATRHIEGRLAALEGKGRPHSTNAMAFHNQKKRVPTLSGVAHRKPTCSNFQLHLLWRER